MQCRHIVLELLGAYAVQAHCAKAQPRPAAPMLVEGSISGTLLDVGFEKQRFDLLWGQ
jgi:hypothetical protein